MSPLDQSVKLSLEFWQALLSCSPRQSHSDQIISNLTFQEQPSGAHLSRKFMETSWRHWKGFSAVRLQSVCRVCAECVCVFLIPIWKRKFEGFCCSHRISARHNGWMDGE